MNEVEINKEQLIEAFKDPESFDKFVRKLIDDIYEARMRKIVCKWLEEKVNKNE